MKKILAYSFLTLFAISCNDNEVEPLDESCIAVSYMEGICGTAILQIKDERFFYLGETANGYDNVFSTMFHCDVDEQKLNKELFYVSLLEDNDIGNCARCLATVAYSGDKFYFMDVNESCKEMD